MNKQNKIIIVMIILGIALIILIAYLEPEKETLSDEFVECLGNNSVLYLQTGCPYCQVQKDLFEDKVELLTIVNCADNPLICQENNIVSIPTWEFGEINLVGIQSISLLENLTGCHNG